MSETPGALKVGYWNCLANDDHNLKRRYVEEIVSEYDPDILVLTECREELADMLNEEFDYTDFAPVIRRRGTSQGICVIGKESIDVKRSPLSVSVKGRNFYDKREKISLEATHPELGVVAVHSAHISHPHHFHFRPSMSLRRLKDWPSVATTLGEETKSLLWFSDTNTVLAAVVAWRLKLKSIGVELLDHEGGPTWGYHNGETPRMLYLDRCAASESLVPRTTLTTLPKIIGQVACPSDHRAILAVVQ